MYRWILLGFLAFVLPAADLPAQPRWLLPLSDSLTLDFEATFAGLVPVRKGDRSGYVLADGKLHLFPYQYFQLTRKHLVLVKKNGLWGLFDRVREVEVIPPVYQKLQQIGENVFGARTYDKLALIRSDNSIISDYGNSPFVTRFGSIVYVGRTDGYRLLHHNGEWVDGRVYDRIETYPGATVGAYLRNGKFGLVDRAGRELTGARFDGVDTRHSTHRYFVAKLGEKWGLVDSFGQVALDFRYQEIMRAPRDVYTVKEDSSYFLFDPVRRVRLFTMKRPAEYVGSYCFAVDNLVADTLYNVLTGEKWPGVHVEKQVEPDSLDPVVAVHRQPRRILLHFPRRTVTVDSSITKLEPFRLGWAIATVGAKKGCIDTTGRWVVPAEYQEVYRSAKDAGLVTATRDGKEWVVIDRSGAVISPVLRYHPRHAERKGAFLILPKNGKQGIFRLGTTVMPDQFFTRVQWLSDGVFLVQDEKKYGMLAY